MSGPAAAIIRPVQLLSLCSRSLLGTAWAPGHLGPSWQAVLQQQGVRQMGVWVHVDNNDLNTALKKLNTKIKESGLQEELKWRQHHIPKSEMRFLKEREAYNREMARRIAKKLHWLRKRRYVEM